ncbi:hypothetical protein Caka_0685 [Coraliomargarita akajimensis DSM 45221]|uniref:Uncharacterized protein n=2 Tax=Coraliomargarita TaxID=442430 RepID=D5EPH2_CORAD|nr:hypothetical protein Caka_0685 [Coraliomargarita akajimensis DSM 45221]
MDGGMRLTSSRTIIAISICIALCAALGIWQFFAWLRTDEPKLDYSQLGLRERIQDPEVNGYTVMREFSLQYRMSQADEDLLLESFESDAGAVDWDAVQVLLEDQTELMETFRHAFGMGTFYFDEVNTPETMIPEIGILRDYVRLRILQSRFLRQTGAEACALDQLLEIQQDLNRYQQSGGALISLLVGISCKQLVAKEVFEQLDHCELTTEQGRFYANQFVDAMTVEHIQSAFKHEFHFASYCVHLIHDDPETLFQLVDADQEATAVGRAIYNGGVRYVLKPNRTINHFYRAYSEIIDQADLPAKQRKLDYNQELLADLGGPKRDHLLTRNPFGRILLAILFPTVEAVVAKTDQFRAEFAALQLAIALNAYYTESGELPDTLAQLVPEFITALPVDPYDGEPMRYSKEQKIIYSVGVDFIDQGGSRLPSRMLATENELDCAEEDETEPTYHLSFVP